MSKKVTFPATRGERLRAARLSAGLTQAMVSQITGIEQPTISAVENGEGGMSIDRWILIARALDESLDTLLNY